MIRADIKKIRGNPNNPRIIKDEKFKKLVQSIQEFPQMLEKRPLICETAIDGKYVVLGGNMRLRACADAGITEIPIELADDWSIEQKRQFVIKDNIGYGEWDYSALAAEYEMDELTDWGLDIPDLKNLLFEPPSELENDSIKQSVQTDIKYGDIINVGSHILVCADSRDKSLISKVCSQKKIDTYIIDPPYDEDSYYQESIPENDGSRLLVFWDYKRFAIACHAAFIKGWNPRYEFIWDNVTSWYTPNSPLARHKACGYFSNNSNKYDFDAAIIKDDKKRTAGKVHNTRGDLNYTPLNGAVHLRTVESFNNAQESKDYKHAKPIKWIEAIFQGIGGDLYVDFFAGSGMTMVICEKLQKKSINFELTPINCQIIIDRMIRNFPIIEVKINGKPYSQKQ